MDSIKKINDYLTEADWRVKETANSTHSLQGLNGFLANNATKEWWLDIYPEHIKKANEDGYIYIHDLSSLSAYCAGFNTQYFLNNKFTAKNGVTSNPPKHLTVALDVLINWIFGLSGEFAGAQALSSFDVYLSAYVKEDNLTYREVYQAIEGFIYKINFPGRIAMQLPFSNITMDLKPTKAMKDQYAMIGGELKNYTYGELQPEINMINKAFAEVMMNGDAMGNIFSFPIPTYAIDEDFDWDGVPEEVWEMAARLGIPYFSNYINSDMSPTDAMSMCCRLKLSLKDLRKRSGGLFASAPNTGAVGVVTLNLPLIALDAKGNKEKFFEDLRHYCAIASESLEIKRDIVESLFGAELQPKLIESVKQLFSGEKMESLYPFATRVLADSKEKFGEYLFNHFSVIGVIGGYEMCKEFDLANGIKHDEHFEYTAEHIAFQAETLQVILDEIPNIQEKTGHLYNLEFTPCESASFTLGKKVQKKGGCVSGSPEIPYLTNSTLPHSSFLGNLEKYLEDQNVLQPMATGGTVSHLFLGQRITAKKAKELVRYLCENYKIPYFSLTPSFSICPTHGYISGQHFECPECGEKTLVYSRVVGFYKPVQQWNEGKVAEYNDRTFVDEEKI